VRGPGPPRHAQITVQCTYVLNNRDLHFVAHKLIGLCAMLMKFVEILVSQAGSQDASQGEALQPGHLT